MNKMLVSSVVALLFVPQWVCAQAYKCKQSDGSVAFQDHPCAAGTTGAMVDLPPVQSYSPGSVGNPDGSNGMGDGGGSHVNRDIDAVNARIEAENRQTRCNAARQRLGVLKEERPVYHRDNEGNRVYIEDKDRPAAIAEAQREVATSCQ